MDSITKYWMEKNAFASLFRKKTLLESIPGWAKLSLALPAGYLAAKAIGKRAMPIIDSFIDPAIVAKRRAAFGGAQSALKPTQESRILSQLIYDADNPFHS